MSCHFANIHYINVRFVCDIKIRPKCLFLSRRVTEGTAVAGRERERKAAWHRQHGRLAANSERSLGESERLRKRERVGRARRTANNFMVSAADT